MGKVTNQEVLTRGTELQNTIQITSFEIEREVFAADLRNELKHYEYEEPWGETQEFTVIKKNWRLFKK